MTRVGVVLLMAAVAACGGDGPAVSRSPDPDEVFFRDLRQLTFGGQNAEAYFSPDGRQLIFQRTSAEHPCDQQFVMHVDGTETTRVSTGAGATTCGFFYGGGARILFSSTHHQALACPPRPDYTRGYVWALHDFDIYTALPDGSDLRRLTTTAGYDAEGTVSPDGRTIVFTSIRDGDLDIYTMNVDGSGLRRLTTTPGYDGGAMFSPNGHMITYRAWHPDTPEELADYRDLLAASLVRPSRMEIWIMNADGSEQRQITDLGGANFAPAFHPDGRRIIFSSNHEDPRSRNFDLYLIDLDGSALTKVTTNDDFDSFPMFSPDGTTLVFASNRFGTVPGETNIFIATWVEQ